MRATPQERLVAKTKIDPATNCWNWTAATSGKDRDYSAFWYEGRVTSGHRASYLIFVGPIPDGHEVDHTCRNTLCVNPEHLEAVTQAENNRRSDSISAVRARVTHCPQGHPYDEANTYTRPGSTNRECRKCRCAVVQRRKAALREMAAA